MANDKSTGAPNHPATKDFLLLYYSIIKDRFRNQKPKSQKPDRFLAFGNQSISEPYVLSKGFKILKLLLNPYLHLAAGDMLPCLLSSGF
jgi:hypothetical protein